MVVGFDGLQASEAGVWTSPSWRATKPWMCCPPPGSATPGPGTLRRPRPGWPCGASGDGSVNIDRPFLGTLQLIAAAAPDGADPQLLFCENETNLARRFDAELVTPYPKDGINDHVIHGAATVNPAGAGTKCAFWYQVAVPPGQTVELRLRLGPLARRLRGVGPELRWRGTAETVRARRGNHRLYHRISRRAAALPLRAPGRGMC